MANDLKVQFSRAPRDDSDIATAIAHILEWNVQIPEGKVHARVENGWVTLAGEVDYDYQMREVEPRVNHVRGVAGVQNFIIVRPPASPEAVEAAIEQAFRREAEVDARHVKVGVTDHTAKLYGHGHSMREASAAADIPRPASAVPRPGRELAGLMMCGPRPPGEHEDMRSGRVFGIISLLAGVAVLAWPARPDADRRRGAVRHPAGGDRHLQVRRRLRVRGPDRGHPGDHPGDQGPVGPAPDRGQGTARGLRRRLCR